MTRRRPTAPLAQIIAIEGPIGVGKTTLARRLASTYETDLMLEGASENPFLTRFYADRDRFALPTQLHFLCQRVEQLQRLRQDDLFRPVYVTDYMLEKDRIFAELNLDPNEFELYCSIYDRLVTEVPNPDLVIYLQASVATLSGRIKGRGRAYEESIEKSYLADLSCLYLDFFRRYDAAPVLIIDTETVNFAESDTHYDDLLRRIARGVSGREHFISTIRLW